ncbi:MAG: hypothetical protein INF87_12120 [Roseomonas sp.]|nr:hypothetical protein [Roseomonas sp.]
MIAFIDDQRGVHGVEPICKVLPIAPSTYFDHQAKRADPDLLSDRAKRDALLLPEIRRVHKAHFEVYGAQKLWRQLGREGFSVARCTSCANSTTHSAQQNQLNFLLVEHSAINALAEIIKGLYKSEVSHRRGPWRSFEAVEFATLEWVDWFNTRRSLAPIGYIPPAEAEERYYASLAQSAMAAQLKQNSLRQTRGGSLQPRIPKVPHRSIPY